MENRRIDITGKNYEIDKETGFLTAKAGYTRGVSAKAKQQFLDGFKETGNFRKAAKLAGIAPITIYEHFTIDRPFKAAYRELVEMHCDDVEENLLKMTKHNVAAAFGFLKAFRAERWNDRKIIETKENKDEKLDNLLNALKNTGKLIDINESDKE